MTALSTPKIGGPEKARPGCIDLADEARRARRRILLPTLTLLSASAAVIAVAVHRGQLYTAFGFAAAGAVAFSFVEYAVHRWVFHRRFPDGRGLARFLHLWLDHLHVEHHARPWDANHNGGTLKDTLPPAAGVFLVLALLFPLPTMPVFWAGVVGAFALEEWLHHLTHYVSIRNPYLTALRRHHNIHHSLPGSETNFGLSSPLWDLALGTTYPRRGPGSKRATQTIVSGVAFGLVACCAGSASAGEGVGGCEPVAPGECIQVTAEGTGSNVVLIPGLFGSAFGFRNLVPLLLADGNRVIIVEPLGVGFSSRPPKADYSLTAQARRIATALDRWNVTDAIVVTHSIAGTIGLRLALLEPSRVRALISIEGGPAEDVTTPAFRRAMKLAPLLKLLGAGRVVRGRVKGMLESRSGDRSWVTEEVVDGYAAGPSRDIRATLDAFSQMARSREPELLAPRLAEIRCPVRLVLGQASHEGGPTPEEIATFSGRLRHFEITRVPSVGNFIFEEAPRAVADIVQEFSGRAPAGHAVSRR